MVVTCCYSREAVGSPQNAGRGATTSQGSHRFRTESHVFFLIASGISIDFSTFLLGAESWSVMMMMMMMMMRLFIGSLLFGGWVGRKE